MKISEISNADGPQIGAQVCIPNINDAERRKRLASGGILFLISLIILAALMAFGVSRWWRLALLPFFFGSGIGFLPMAR